MTGQTFPELTIEVVLNDEAEEFAWIGPQKALKELDTVSCTAVSIHEYISQWGTR